jgi:hypothetical protein
VIYFFAGFFFGAVLTAFLTAGFAATFAFAIGLASLLREDLILAALFLWIKFFFIALSTSTTAFFTFSAVLDFRAPLIASFSCSLKRLLTFSLFLSCLSFFLADFMTGMWLF